MTLPHVFVPICNYNISYPVYGVIVNLQLLSFKNATHNQRVHVNFFNMSTSLFHQHQNS